jgi:hypothetical protein
MANLTKTYPMSDPAAACAKILAAGGPKIDPTQAKGTISSNGCVFNYVLNNGTIAITLAHKPMVIPQSMIADKLDEFFGSKA